MVHGTWYMVHGTWLHGTSHAPDPNPNPNPNPNMVDLHYRYRLQRFPNVVETSEASEYETFQVDTVLFVALIYCRINPIPSS